MAGASFWADGYWKGLRESHSQQSSSRFSAFVRRELDSALEHTLPRSLQKVDPSIFGAPIDGGEIDLPEIR
jgi:hypothetical protein